MYVDINYDVSKKCSLPPVNINVLTVNAQNLKIAKSFLAQVNFILIFSYQQYWDKGNHFVSRLT